MRSLDRRRSALVSLQHCSLSALNCATRPLNPVLGECALRYPASMLYRLSLASCRLFYGFWPDQDGRGQTNLVVEQVSHHPPITAYYICNPSKGLALQGHSAQKTSFSSGSIVVKQIGHAILAVDLENGNKEQFLITLPRLRIDGLWYGSPYIELTETSYIQSSSGWLSTVCPPNFCPFHKGPVH